MAVNTVCLRHANSVQFKVHKISTTNYSLQDCTLKSVSCCTKQENLPLFETMIVKYSPEIFDENPRRKPFGLVVVKPTRIFSAIVDLQLPMKSYLMMDSGLMLTPISVQ